MKFFLFFFLSISYYSFAQSAKTLTYSEIDSLLYLFEESQAFDKGVKLSLEASQKSAKQDSLCGEYFDWAAYFYELSNDIDNATECYQKALNAFEESLGQNTARYATTLNLFGLFHKNIGNYNLALPLLTKAKDIRAQILGKEDPDFAASLNNLALLHQDLGNYNLALSLFNQTKDIRESVLGKDNPDYAQGLNNLANLYRDMGYYHLALPLLIETVSIAEKVLGKEHYAYAISLGSLAALHKTMGNYNLALPLYMEAVDIDEKVYGKEHPSYATSLNNLAALHYHMKNYHLALPLFNQAKSIREKVLGNEHPTFASSLNNLALLHQNMQNYDLALPLLNQAKDINGKILGKEHPEYASSLNNLALLHQNMKSYNLALPLYIQAKDIREKTLGKEHPDFITSLNNLAKLYQIMGNYAATWEVLEQAIYSCSKLQLKLSINEAWVSSLEKAAYPSSHHLEKIVESLNIVYHLLEQDSTIYDVISKQIMVSDLVAILLTKLRFQVSSEEDKLRMLSQSDEWLQNSLKVLSPKEHTAKAFSLSDQNKSVLLLQATKSERAYRLSELPDSLVWQDKKMLKKQSLLQAQLLERRTKEEKDSLRSELNQTNQDIQVFIQTIKDKYPKYYALKYQQADAKVGDIQVLLDDETVLLEYVLSDSLLHIFKVSKNEVVWVPHQLKEHLNENIKKLHNVLKNYKLLSKKAKESYQEYTVLAYWFYKNTIEPILKNDKEIKNLIIVVDGELGHLPFETFLIEQAPQSETDYSKLHYLVNDYNISYNYSATLWKENRVAPKSKNNGQMLAMAANYKISLDSSMLGVRLPTDQWLRSALKPLPLARKEVELLQENYEGFFAFDQDASERIVKEKATDFAILHFAMHGILDAKQPVLSSLAFTEDNDSTESNFWQAHEISKMQLNADLVVLSACETGFGKFEKGNGIASLARAFMYAGAPAMIVSLWQVNDYATSELMKNFYAHLTSGMNKDEALRQAKLQYIQSAKGILAHPAFWSPFILMGNTDAIYLKQKGGWFWWGVGVGVLVLLSIVLWMVRRKS